MIRHGGEPAVIRHGGEPAVIRRREPAVIRHGREPAVARSRRRLAVTFGLASCVLWLGARAASPARADQARASVGDSAEAWYASAPVANCTSPVGCPPTSPPSAYPAGTLHVGDINGSETARTYLKLDLSTLPPGATAVAGTITLPISSDSSAGSVNAASAVLQLCLAKAPFSDGTSGSTDAPPAVDCTVDSSATYNPAPASGGPDNFTADLAPFLTAWSGGAPDFGLAVVPAPAQAAGDAWHVAFNGRQASGTPHITAALTVSNPTADNLVDATGTGMASTGLADSGPAGATPADTAPASPLTGSAASLSIPTAAAVPASAGPAPAPAPAGASGPAPDQPRQASIAAALSRATGPVPWPFLWFPLLLVVGVTYAIRTFTSPVPARRSRHERR